MNGVYINERQNDIKSKEYKNDMIFILRELHQRKKLSEKEYYRAVELVRKGEY
ncbi:hypothetical protein [Anaeromicropila populeti]|uniref:Uncharacterized protein n=1 Tax=Anaeromicropila populeti TaxID=37658 RepID=A0A1I6JGZ0_9FIRM|nr:hypothetical protein [Anaeromicropila populeti]SFR78231.1 hypothetical protein SAMN05661086_01678 [Anaeromicropila populeti]